MTRYRLYLVRTVVDERHLGYNSLRECDETTLAVVAAASFRGNAQGGKLGGVNELTSDNTSVSR
jgi:hypothetical protein